MKKVTYERVPTPVEAVQYLGPKSLRHLEALAREAKKRGVIDKDWRLFPRSSHPEEEDLVLDFVSSVDGEPWAQILHLGSWLVLDPILECELEVVPPEYFEKQYRIKEKT